MLVCTNFLCSDHSSSFIGCSSVIRYKDNEGRNGEISGSLGGKNEDSHLRGEKCSFNIVYLKIR
jgi:hypothetical protein